ncbi:MAG: proton-conducting transporter membrane subunit, partial [Erythrobacter sp.]
MPFDLSFSFIAPLVLLLAALPAFANGGMRPGLVPGLSETAALFAFLLTIGGLVQVILAEPVGLMVGSGLFAVGLRADLVAATMAMLVGFIGWIVMRYSRTYLDGEEREGLFHGLMLATLAAVLVFAQATSLTTLAIATFLVGLTLRKLLLFYPERRDAHRAATKFAIVRHVGDIALVVAAGILALTHGTTQLVALGPIVQAEGIDLATTAAIACIVIAAGLKTAAFPLHGWLTEVMEAPTPVSALLHAGIINSGGVLLIANADLVQS